MRCITLVPRLVKIDKDVPTKPAAIAPNVTEVLSNNAWSLSIVKPETHVSMPAIVARTNG